MGGRTSKLCMRLLLTASLLLLGLVQEAPAQTPTGVRVPTSPAPAPAARAGAAQPPKPVPVASSSEPTAPTVDVIDFYGFNKVSRDRVRTTLGFNEGGPFP